MQLQLEFVGLVGLSKEVELRVVNPLLHALNLLTRARKLLLAIRINEPLLHQVRTMVKVPVSQALLRRRRHL